MTKSQKGSSFERQICKELSLWWTKGKRDDIFWRTSGSGARATVRKKSKLQTFGQTGDIQATDPLGQPLIDLCSIEIKRGYSKFTIADMLDKSPTAALQEWEKWMMQAESDRELSKAYSWLLITKRNRRVSLVFMPWWLFSYLINVGAKVQFAYPIFTGAFEVNKVSNIIFACTFENFMKYVEPRHIRRLLGKLKRRKNKKPEPTPFFWTTKYAKKTQD